MQSSNILQPLLIANNLALSELRIKKVEFLREKSIWLFLLIVSSLENIYWMQRFAHYFDSTPQSKKQWILQLLGEWKRFYFLCTADS